MIVISDTSPINYLILIGHQDILPAIFGRVIIPTAVNDELRRAKTPAMVRDWVLARPDWCEVLSPENHEQREDIGPGESEAISLTLELAADVLLIDDKRGRRLAQSLGLTVMGSVNILQSAAEKRLLDLREALTKIRETNFRISQAVIDTILREHDKWRQQQPPSP